jgi:hypothetical protein
MNRAVGAPFFKSPHRRPANLKSHKENAQTPARANGPGSPANEPRAPTARFIQQGGQGPWIAGQSRGWMTGRARSQKAASRFGRRRSPYGQDTLGTRGLPGTLSVALGKKPKTWLFLLTQGRAKAKTLAVMKIDGVFQEGGR